MHADEWKKFVAVCGMMGSAHEGERAAAAAFAYRLLRASGLTWADVLRNPSPPAPSPAPASTPPPPPRKYRPLVQDMLDELLIVVDDLSDSSQFWVREIAKKRQRLSLRQREVIESIYDQVFR